MATKGFKTQLQYGNAATVAGSTVWVNFALIDDITPPKIEADDIDVSSMDSPTDANGLPFKEYTAGWAEAGEIEVKCQFEKAQNMTVWSLFRQPKGYRIILPDASGTAGSKWACDGYLKAIQNEVEREGIVHADFTIKLTGVPAFTPAP